MRLRIHSGRIIDPANRVDDIGDVCIADGKIIAVGETPSDFTADREIDASGQIVCPGLVDLCARLREPGAEHKATVATESRAAARSGITTLCCPPDTNPIIDTPAVVELIHQRAQASGMAHVEVLGALTKDLGGKQLADIGALGLAGCLGVSNARAPIHDTEVMRRAMEYAQTFGLRVYAHGEDPWLARDRMMHDGEVSTRLGLPGIPEIAETIGVARDLLLVEQTGTPLHFCRLSAGPAVDMIRDAREHGLPVSADVAMHQLHLDHRDLLGFNSQCYVLPPLRSPEDTERLCAGVASGVVQVICSDHQPHERDAKENPISQTEPGISGLDTMLPLALRLAQNKAIPLSKVIAAMTCEPALLLGVKRGTLTPGSGADVCVFDPKVRYVLDEDAMASKGKNSPFLGQEFLGRVTHTIFAGKLVYG